MTAEEKSYNRTLGRIRILLTLILVGVLLMLAQPTLVSLLVGLPFLALGEATRFWASGHLLKTQELITSGPYRFTRNPLYLGRLLIFTGLCIMVNLPNYASWVMLLLGWLLFFGYYLPRKERVEPARLRETHGEPFERYWRAVPALFPTLRPYPEASDARWSRERMLRNREHWMVVFQLLIVAYLTWRALS